MVGSADRLTRFGSLPSNSRRSASRKVLGAGPGRTAEGEQASGSVRAMTPSDDRNTLKGGTPSTRPQGHGTRVPAAPAMTSVPAPHVQRNRYAINGPLITCQY